MTVDDYGRFYADERLLKSNLFPLKADIRTADISRWIAACEKAGLIVTYTSADKSYLQINNFNQVLRQKREKFPSPNIRLSDDTQMTSRCEADASLKGNESESETNPNIPPKAEPHPDFVKFQEWVKENAPSVGQMKEPFTEKQFLKAKKEFGQKAMCVYLQKMHNWQGLKKNKSANLTMRDWIRRDIERQQQQTIVPIYKQGMVR